MSDTKESGKSTAKTEVLVRSENEREQEPRTREASLGGVSLQLSVVNSHIPGYTLCWVNDDRDELNQKYSAGFDFVTPEEAGSHKKVRSLIVENKDVADRVSRHVGKHEDGSPMRAYLMKCPNDIWKEMEANRHAQADRWDDAILRQSIGVENGHSYVPNGMQTRTNLQPRN